MESFRNLQDIGRLAKNKRGFNAFQERSKWLVVDMEEHLFLPGAIPVLVAWPKTSAPGRKIARLDNCANIDVLVNLIPCFLENLGDRFAQSGADMDPPMRKFFHTPVLGNKRANLHTGNKAGIIAKSEISVPQVYLGWDFLERENAMV
jgi:hypothetical protein